MPWTAACQSSLSFTISQSLPKFMFIDSMVPSNHLILSPHSLPSIFPSIKIFSSNSALHVRYSKYWNFSFTSVLPMSIQGGFPLGLMGLISLPSKGLSGVFSSTSLKASILWCSALLMVQFSHPIYNYWKNHSSDSTRLCQQSDVFAF